MTVLPEVEFVGSPPLPARHWSEGYLFASSIDTDHVGIAHAALGKPLRLPRLRTFYVAGQHVTLTDEQMAAATEGILTLPLRVEMGVVQGRVVDSRGDMITDRVAFRRLPPRGRIPDALDALCAAQANTPAVYPAEFAARLPAGSYSVWCVDRRDAEVLTRFVSVVEVQSGKHIMCELRAPPTGILRVNLDGYEGADLLSAQFAVVDDLGIDLVGLPAATVVTGTEWSTANLPVGDYLLKMWLPGTARETVPITIRPGRVTIVRLGARPGHALPLELVDGNGQALPFARVRVFNREGFDCTPPGTAQERSCGMVHHVADADGRLTLRDMPPDAYTIEAVSQDDRLHGDAVVEVAQSGEGDAIRVVLGE